MATVSGGGAGGGSTKKPATTKKPGPPKAPVYQTYTPPSIGGYSVASYSPSADYTKIASDRINAAARGQFDANKQARDQAIRDYLAATGSLRDQENSSIANARANNLEMRDRLTNTMASRGTARGEGAGVNYANLDAKASALQGQIHQEAMSKIGQVEEQNVARQNQLIDADRTLKAQLPSKIEELRQALEGQDFQRYQAQAQLSAQAAQMAQSRDLALAQIEAQQVASANSVAAQNYAYERQKYDQQAYAQDQAQKQQYEAIASAVAGAAQAGKSWTQIKSLIRAATVNYPELNNVDLYKSMLGASPASIGAGVSPVAPGTAGYLGSGFGMTSPTGVTLGGAFAPSNPQAAASAFAASTKPVQSTYDSDWLSQLSKLFNQPHPTDASLGYTPAMKAQNDAMYNGWLGTPSWGLRAVQATQATPWWMKGLFSLGS